MVGRIRILALAATPLLGAVAWLSAQQPEQIHVIAQSIPGFQTFLPAIQQAVRLPVSAQTATSSDGKVTFKVPDGLHSSAGPFTIAPVSGVPRAVGTVYQIGPDGTVFDPPATITIVYDDKTLPTGVLETNLTAGYYTKGFRIPFSLGVSRNTVSNTLTGLVQHLTNIGPMPNPLMLVGTKPGTVVSGHGSIVGSRQLAKVGDTVIWIAQLNPGATTWRCGCEFCPIPQGISGASISLPTGISVTTATGGSILAATRVAFNATPIPFDQSGCNGPTGYFSGNVFTIESTVVAPSISWTEAVMNTSTCCGGAVAKTPFGSVAKGNLSRKLTASQESDRPSTKESDSLIYDVDPAKPIVIRGEDWDKFGGDILLLWNDFEIAQIAATDTFTREFTVSGRFQIDSCNHLIRAFQLSADDVLRSVDIRLAGNAKALAAQGVKDRRGGGVQAGDPICAGRPLNYGDVANVVTVDPNGALIASEQIDQTTGLPSTIPTFVYSPKRNIRVVGQILAPVIQVATGSGSDLGFTIGQTPDIASYDPRKTSEFKLHTITTEERALTGTVNYPNQIFSFLKFAAISDETTNEFKGAILLGGQFGSSATIYTPGSLLVRRGLSGRGVIYTNINITIEGGTNLTAEGPIALASTGTILLR